MPAPIAWIVAVALAAALLVPGTFDQSNTGYEGQPGHQSGNNGGGGNTGYEGQPGNQSSG